MIGSHVLVSALLAPVLLGFASGHPGSLIQSKKGRQPTEDDFEYGDKERAISSEDSSDFSLHQFLANDDGRQGSSVVDDDSGTAEMARSQALAADDHFNSEDTPDNSDAFAQLHAKMNQATSLLEKLDKRDQHLKKVQAKKRRQSPDDDFEYGDRERAVTGADSSDFSIHQFLDADDGREGSSVVDDDSGEAEMARARAMAADDHFNSEDTPDTDSFAQTVKGGRRLHAVNQAKKRRQSPTDGDDFEYGDRERAVSGADSSDFSIHQFLNVDDGREGSSAVDDDSGEADMARARAMAADDHFNSEDTPDDTDSFAQTAKGGRHAMNQAARHGKRVVLVNSKHRRQPDDGDSFEYGDKEMAVSAADSSDFSMHQFLNADDGREGSSAADDDSGATEMARAQAMAADDHFNSEDTPDSSDSLAQIEIAGIQNFKKHLRGRRNGNDEPDNEEDSTGYVYGDSEANARNEDSSDFSVHQFLARDEGREGTDSSADEEASSSAATQRPPAVEDDDTFNSEDTPDTSLAQVEVTK